MSRGPIESCRAQQAMNTVIIITEPGDGLGGLRRLIPDTCSVQDAGFGRLLIQDVGRRAFLGPCPEVWEVMDPRERDLVLQTVVEPTFFGIDYSDLEFCKDLLMAVADRDDVVVDNDHGVIAKGAEFARMLRSRPGWDWRVSP